MLLNVRFESSAWRVVLCSVTGLAVLRGASSGLAKPSLGVRKLQDALLSRLDDVAKVDDSKLCAELAGKLTWTTDAEAFGASCLIIHGSSGDADHKTKMSQRISEIKASGIADGLMMWSLVRECHLLYGEQIVTQAVERVREARIAPPARA